MESHEDLFYMLAHDIRGPLSTVKILASLLELKLRKSSVDPADLLKILGNISRCVTKGERLLEHTLNASKIGTNTMKLCKKNLDLASIITSCVDDVRPYAEQAKCVINLTLDSVSGCWDELRLTEIVFNLLSNAVKYGPGHPILVELKKDADVAVLKIKDQGHGISKTEQNWIFEKGTRADERPPGMGLGLWIVKTLVEQHEGEVSIHSVPDRGTTFTVKLPINLE